MSKRAAVPCAENVLLGFFRSEEKDPFVRVVFSDAATALELGSQLPVTTSIPAVEETAEAKVERMRAQRLARFAPR